MTQPASGRPVAIDLAAVATPGALGAALDTLRLDCGLDSERAVARAAQGHGGLARATIKDMLNGTRVPTEASLRVFLNACGVAEASQVVAWLAVRNRVAHDRSARSDGTQRVRDASARQLGVHSAIASPSGADVEFLPAYVPRDTDDPYTDPVGVRARLRAAAATGGFILLVGESSVGKTRTAFEAIRAELGDWWLVHPDPGQLAILAADPPARTLVWLDELHRYVDRKLGLTKAVIDRLLKAPGPIVLVATAWPSQYTAWTAAAPAAIAPGRPDDPYKEQRAVVALADMVRIAPTFSEAERARAEEAAASGDARLRIALAHPEYGLTQTLAAAPQLVARWDHADPYARAVLTAAVDATRLGMRHPLTSELLKSMAPAYCTGRQRAAAPADWFEAAVAYATELLHGAAAALVPDSGEGTEMGETAGFAVADYLLQYASAQRRVQPVPAGAWEALISHARHRDDIERLASSADDRLRLRYAIPLYRRFSEAGGSQANDRLTELTARRERTEDTLEEIRRHPGNNQPVAEILATSLASSRQVEELRALHRGDELAAERLAELLTARHREELVGRAASGDRKAARLLTEHDMHSDLWIQHDYGCGCLQRRTYWRAWLLAEDGHVDDAIAIVRGHQYNGDDPNALLAWLLAEHGRVSDLMALAKYGERQAARLLLSRDYVEALRDLYDAPGGRDSTYAYNRLKSGEIDGKKVRRPVRAGSGLGAWRLAELLADPRRVEDALAVLRTYADLPLSPGWTMWADRRLAEVLFDHGRVDELRLRAVRSSAAAGRLAELLAQRSQIEEALTILRSLADQDKVQASWLLIRLLVEHGRVDDALAILRPLVELHESDRKSQYDRWEWPTRRLAQLLAAEGRIGELRELIESFHVRANLGDHYAARRLAELLAEYGRPGELRAEIDAGNPYAAERVVEQLARQGKLHEADRMWRFGLTAEGLIEEPVS